MTIIQRILLPAVLVLGGFSALAQQVADTLFRPAVPKPVYDVGKGPTIFLDQAHENFHTAEGRFKPFAALLRRDGYVVKPFFGEFTVESLSEGKILVIANARTPRNAAGGASSTSSAFTGEEITAVNQWVRNGGALFLIADHMPFPAAAGKLAASFGFTFYNGFAMRKHDGKDIFGIGSGLHESAITQGRDESEVVSSVQTFTGQAFKIPDHATSLVTLDDRYEVRMPEVAWEFRKDTPTIEASGLSQGAFLKYENGRVVVFGEAAMFSAQRYGNSRAGMNAKDAGRNAQFLLNIMHWLDGVLE